ncbi:class I adenylate-forming enzyme family protein [Paenactinomyces guangxiensis]|uniref:Acyl--CoA ligase n=1 Tax=Paenactinomyces guangxiensis TaxID=1490290 RepID=A0A7W1WN72_9BACL|nr:class I adenylate-forming enzyme family protein [Paenactinomyces guangxiensis]MBA4492984.1 acyl--CoA ligase [Paenactinomyces guangxiensis]MBH8590167.1 acyl--CoA ligase [Paenactinomyces guangxiensis]
MLVRDILGKWRSSGRTAIIYKGGKISYRDLYEQCNYYHTLLQRTVTSDEARTNIGIFLPNSLDYAIAYFAVSLLGRIIVPIHVHAKLREMISTIDYCDVEWVITNCGHKSKLTGPLTGTGRLKIFDMDEYRKEPPYDRERETDEIGQAVPGQEENVAILLHTSGTTSYPKRVMLTHKNLLTNIRSNIHSLKLTEDDRTLISLPMSFGYCHTAQFLTHLYLGASIVIMDGIFTPHKFCQQVQEDKVTNFTAVPSFILSLLSYQNLSQYDLSSLRILCFGGGRMPAEKLQQLQKKLPHIGFVQTYGQTEASPRITCLLPGDSRSKAGSVGKPIPGVQVRIINTSGTDAAVGEVGEIIVKGDNVMKGYYKRPAETASVIRNGWLYTGDLARYDEEKYIYLVGRKKNIIISGGLNIYPEEIEELLLSHPAVKEVCVKGEENSLLGEVPVAYIVPKEGSPIREDQLKRFCIDQLDIHKVPRRVQLVKSLPKTHSGKVQRYAIKS